MLYERTIDLTRAAVTARPSTMLAWDVWGSATTQPGTIRADPGGMGAVYTAPCTVPPGLVFVPGVVFALAKSTLYRLRHSIAFITVEAGIKLSSSAPMGVAQMPACHLPIQRRF